MFNGSLGYIEWALLNCRAHSLILISDQSPKNKLKMDIHIIENTWAPANTKSMRGWGNGYVIIPKGHALHGVDYDNVHVLIPHLEVHGGLTYSDAGKNLKDFSSKHPTSEDAWVVGFDTSHWDDTLEKWPKSRVLEETNKLKAQLEAYK